MVYMLKNKGGEEEEKISITRIAIRVAVIYIFVWLLQKFGSM
jgi:hypothetical protein